MSERMFGFETEYAITGIQGGECMDRGLLVDLLMQVARKHFPHLPDARTSGMFLTNGSRLYIDQGCHPELCTPECTNPWDAVRYIKAGEQIMNEIVSRMNSEAGAGSEIFCFLCNVDYIRQVTWGCHESFLNCCDPLELPRQIIPYLVSRTIYTGAGGFNPFSAGIQFTLSPRSAHIDQVISSGSTNSRPLFHTKDEPLSASGYHRLHIICGESLCSEWAEWLKVGATALVVAMIEAGLKPGSGFELKAPLAALRVIAADTRCQSRVRLEDGSEANALQIQHHYLSLAESHLGDPFMPLWAEQVCARWKQTLDLLGESPERARKMLDWPMKQALYAHYAGSRGMEWETLGRWNHVVGRLKTALDRTRRRCPLCPDSILGPNSPILEEVAQLTPYVRESGLRWDELEMFLQLRRELLEIDTRFGQLGEKGVFHALDAAGFLEHHMDGVDNIEHAVAHPPAAGRAKVRGEFVRRAAGIGNRYHCDWSAAFDMVNKLCLDLSNPFATEERWVPMREVARASAGSNETVPPNPTPFQRDLFTP
jgi:proteasome accessory factor A